MEEQTRTLDSVRDRLAVFIRPKHPQHPTAQWVFCCNSHCKQPNCRHIARAEYDGSSTLAVTAIDHDLLRTNEIVKIVGSK